MHVVMVLAFTAALGLPVCFAGVAAIRAIDAGPDLPRPDLMTPGPAAAGPGSPLAALQHYGWTLTRAGLTGPSAWLTAPRETAGFAARRAAIVAAYEEADRPVAAMLAAAGWPEGG